MVQINPDAIIFYMEKMSKLGKAIEAGAVALSLTLPHEHIVAAEINPETSWVEGIAEIKRSVLEDPIEHAAVFIVYEDGSAGWLPTMKGETGEVISDLRIIVPGIASEREGRNIARVCDIHTHPVAAIEAEFNVKDGHDAYSPPSYGDTFVISRGGRQDMMVKLGNEIGLSLESKSHVAAVFDPHGVWYYRALSEEEIVALPLDERPFNEIVDEFEHQQKEFVQSSTAHQFNFTNAYHDMQQAYKTKVRTHVRFVPYEKIADEPVCAGVE